MSQIGSGDRSERIRTYNFMQNRVTDHRIGLTIHGIQDVLDAGAGLTTLRAALQEHQEQEALALLQL